MISPTARIVCELEERFSKMSFVEKDVLQGIVLPHERYSILNMLEGIPVDERKQVVDALNSIRHILTNLTLRMRAIALLRMIIEGKNEAAALLETILMLSDEHEKEDVLEQLLVLLCRCSEKKVLLEEITRILEKLPDYSFMPMLKTIGELPPDSVVTTLKRAQAQIDPEKAFMATFVVKSQ